MGGGTKTSNCQRARQYHIHVEVQDKVLRVTTAPIEDGSDANSNCNMQLFASLASREPKILHSGPRIFVLFHRFQRTTAQHKPPPSNRQPPTTMTMMNPRIVLASAQRAGAHIRCMSANAKVWIDKDTRVICQGFTGKQVSTH